ncbi:MAG: GIY-YIG nuclease family protein [Candidatus Omnitrophica bacterium]|nr:GIY-YIG nuclease family protein [Candidatus Omnitrophota bacterium]
MYTLYILISQSTKRYYVGQTSNLKKRIKYHLSGYTSFGKRNKDIELVFNKVYDTRSKAVKAERFIKKQKSHSFIQDLIAGKISVPL